MSGWTQMVGMPLDDLGPEVRQVEVDDDTLLTVQLVLLSDNLVFLMKKNGYYALPDADRVLYDHQKQLQPMQKLLDLLKISTTKPWEDFARCYAVKYKEISMRVVMLRISSDALSMHFAPHGAFIVSEEVTPRHGNYSITTGHIMQAIRRWGWSSMIHTIPLGMPYRIVLQSSQTKNIFLQLFKPQGYYRLPGAATNETKQQAIAHAGALAKAIVGPEDNIKSYELGSTRYIIVTVPAHGGQIFSDEHMATKYIYQLEDSVDEEKGCFFSLEGISKSRGDVAESTQNNIKLLLENNYLVN
jgi:hypothetical protein